MQAVFRTDRAGAFSGGSVLHMKAPSRSIFARNPRPPRNQDGLEENSPYVAVSYGGDLLIRDLLHVLKGFFCERGTRCPPKRGPI